MAGKVKVSFYTGAWAAPTFLVDNEGIFDSLQTFVSHESSFSVLGSLSPEEAQRPLL